MGGNQVLDPGDSVECQSSRLLHPQLEGVILSVLRHQFQLLHLKVESFAEKKHIIKDRKIPYAVKRYDPETVELNSVNTWILWEM